MRPERRAYFQLAARRTKLQDQYRGKRDIISMCEMVGNIRTKWGEPFASAEDTTAHAVPLASKLAQDGDWDSYMISIADGYGRIVAEIPVRE